jgi:hypothetical protein
MRYRRYLAPRNLCGIRGVDAAHKIMNARWRDILE